MLRNDHYRKVLRNAALLCLFVLAGCESELTPEEGLQRAESYRDSGDYQAAIIELKNVLQNHPQHRDTRLLMSELYILQRDGASAETQLMKARELSPDDLDIRSSLGRAFLLQQNYDWVIDNIAVEDNEPAQIRADLLILRAYAYFYNNELEQAEQNFGQARAADANNAAALAGQALINLQNGNFAEAGQQVEQALALDAANMEAWIIKGRLAYLQSQYESAEQAFRRAIASASGFTFLQPIQTRVYLVQVLIDQEKMDAATRVVDELAGTNSSHPMVHYLRAHIAYESGQFDSAIEHIQVTRSAAPDYDPALLLEGAINYALGNLERGNLALSAYVARHPDNYNARKLLAATQLKLQQPEQAYELVSPLLQQDPNNLQLLLFASGAMRDAGKPDASIPFLQRALQQDPENTDLKLQLASTYLSNAEPDEAIRILQALPPTENRFDKREQLLLLAWANKQDYDSALAYVDDYLLKHPNDTDVLGHSGVVLTRMGKPDAARERFEKALSLQPTNNQMLMTLARLEFQQKNYVRAEQLLERQLSMKPDDADAMYALANIGAQKGEKETAISWLERARKASDQALQPRLVLVKYYLDQGKINQAKEASIEATKIAPGRADVWNTYSVIQNRLGDHIGAIDSLHRALKLQPDSDTILMNLARSQVSAKDLNAAKETLRKLQTLSTDNFQAASMLALIEMKQGNTQKALDIAQQQQASSKNRLNAMALEGDLQMMAGNHTRAVEVYTAARDISSSTALTVKLYTASRRAALPGPERILLDWLQTHPDDTAVRLLLATEYQSSGKTTEAIRQYETLNSQKPDDADILNNLALAYQANKDPKAVTTAEKAYQLDPDNAAIKDTLGWILVQEKNAERGLPLLRDAKALLPDNIEIQYHYAVALAEYGNRDKARKLLQKLVDTETGSAVLDDAKQYLQTLTP